MSKVEWKTLGEVCERNNGMYITAAQMKELSSLKGDILIFAAGNTKVLVPRNVLPQDVIIEKESIIVKSRGYIDFEYCDIPFTHKRELWSYTSKDKTVQTKYLYYYLKSRTDYFQIAAKSNSVKLPQIGISSTDDYYVPIPTISVQRQIVSQLDTFTTLIAKLESELTLRQKQYEFYREELYGDLWTIAEKENNKGLIQIKSFSEIGDIIRGKRFVRDDIKEQGQPCIHYGDMYTYYGVSATETKTFLDYDFPKTMRYAEKGDVVIVGAGENNSDIGVGVAWLGDEKAAVHDACYILKHALDAKYVSHYLRTNIYHQQLKKYVSEGKICSFSGEGLGKVLLPVPFQAESYRQQQIVSQLDTFEQLIAALKREIALRQKQYEFYREKLLTFE